MQGGSAGGLAGGAPAGDGPEEILAGKVERVIFRNPAQDFTVLLVKPGRGREPVVVVGNVVAIEPGDTVRARGRWVENPRYGRQFQATLLEQVLPSSREGIKRLLISKEFLALSPGLADRILDHLGEATLELLDRQPERLLEVPGIGRNRYRKIVSRWAKLRVLRNLILFCQGHGLSAKQALRIREIYHDRALEVIRSAPYTLCREVQGLGFATADGLARRLGWPPDSPARILAGLEHALDQGVVEGHCALPRERLVERGRRVLNCDAGLLRAGIQAGCEQGSLILEPLSGEEAFLYLPALVEAERAVAARLVQLLKGPHPCPPIRPEAALRWVQARIGVRLDAAQKEAVLQAAKAKVMVITGGPGVGKTTIINAIIKIFEEKRLKIRLAAPTGRAARRMKEATGKPALTLHRMLLMTQRKPGSLEAEDEEGAGAGADPGAQDGVGEGAGEEAVSPGDPPAWAPGLSKGLKGDVFIIDESSMLDIRLASRVLKALPDGAQLILVGDVDQLPSVGPGNLLRDVIESGVVPVCRLTKVFRQAAQSAIVTNAHLVNAGRMPVLGRPVGEQEGAPLSDFHFCPVGKPERAAELVLRLASEAVPRRFGLDPLREVQVLSPMRKGVLGVVNLNALLRKRLNPNAETRLEGFHFCLGDKVMQTENNYRKRVFNGEIGYVTGLQPAPREPAGVIEVEGLEGAGGEVEEGGGEEQQVLAVDFDGRSVTYTTREQEMLVPAYAVTIHKSQGSEYPAVIVVLHDQHRIMLQRNLLYTALTRGRRLVVLVGSREAIACAVGRIDARRRVTLLKERLRLAAGAEGAEGAEVGPAS